jgi:hypothetical protein
LASALANPTTASAPLLLQTPFATDRKRRSCSHAGVYAALRRAADAAIGGWSQVSNDPVLDLRPFP